MDERDEGQMDLFGEGGGLEMRLENGADKGGNGLRMVLPDGQAEGDADAAGAVREVFAENGASGRVRVELGRAGTPLAGRPLPPTGVYRPPVREAPPPPDAGPDEPLDPNALPWGLRARAWLAGIEWNGRVAAGVGAALVVAMLLGVWSARGCGGNPPPGNVENVEQIEPAAPPETIDLSGMSAGPMPASEEADDSPWDEPPPAQPVPSDPPPAAPGLPAPFAGWTLSNAKISEDASGLTVTFGVPLFESGAYLSKEGAPVLKALAAKLKGVPDGTRVRVTGFTDNVPLSKPTREFSSNADIAAARADAAVEYLRIWSRHAGIAWDSAAGAEADAPNPNDTKEHRRLNRTVLIRIEPGNP